MIRITETEVNGWAAAIRGMRNPMNSWDKSDSVEYYNEDASDFKCSVGDNDLNLMKKLATAGTDHAKYRRFITVTCDIESGLYWWKEFDTYKVGTVANSCSTMHKLHSRDLTTEDFSCEHLNEWALVVLEKTIATINMYRERFVENSEKENWWQMIQLLPSSFNQKRTVLLNYEVLANIYKSRRNHKLDEWHEFCDWIESLPYSEIITGERGK